MRAFVIPVVYAVLITGASAASPPELEPLVSWARTDSEQLWEAAKFSEAKTVGGYLYRFEFDLTTDGVPELFVASSINSGGALWHVYERQHDSQGVSYSPLTEFNFIPGGVFFLKQEKESATSIVTIFIPLDIHRAIIHTARYQTNGGRDVSTQEIRDDDLYRFPEGFDVGIAVTPNIEKVLLCEYLANPGVQWRPYRAHTYSEFQHEGATEREHAQAMEADCERLIKDFIERSAK